MAVVDVEFRANANFSGLISQANMANAAISKLQASVTSLNAEKMNQAFTEFSKGLTGSGQYIAQTVRVSDATQRFGQDLVNNKLQLKDYAREFGRYVSGRESQIKKLADQQVRMQQSMVVSRGMDPSGRLIAQVFTPTGLTNDLETNTMRATARLQVMNEFLHKASTSVINWGKNTQWAGRQMTVGLTVPLSMLATATGKAFYELDTQLIQMQKVYGTGIKGVGDEAIASIRSQVMDLSRELAKAYGIPVAQTAALAADIAQAGKTGQDLLSSVEQTTKLATLGEIDRQDAMKATLSIQSTFNQNTKELSESINFLNAVENATNVSLQDLVTGIPKAGPVVKALGGDIKDLSLMMVAMKEGGIPASEAANAIKSSLASLINPTQKVTDKMKTFGIDLVGIVDKNAGQLMPTLVEFRNEINKLDELSRQRILEELFGKFQFARVNALFNNLGRAGSQTIQVMELMGLSTAELAGIADKELKTMAESASGRFKRLFATVQGDLAVAGEGILNAGSTILSVISKIINAFEKFPDGLKKFLGGTALLAAVIGPIIMTIGVLGNFFGYIMKGLALMRTFGRRGASDFQLMTAETIATANAGDMLENKLFDQAKAADLMRTSIEKLTIALAEMGAVSSTASRTAESITTNARGRAAAAGTAVEILGGHTVARSKIGREEGGTEGRNVGSFFSIFPQTKSSNAAQGNVNTEMFATEAARQQAADFAGANRAFITTAQEQGKRISQKASADLVKFMQNVENTYEQKIIKFGQVMTGDMKITFEKASQIYASFMSTQAQYSAEYLVELEKISKLKGKKLQTYYDNIVSQRREELQKLGYSLEEIDLALEKIDTAIDTSLQEKAALVLGMSPEIADAGAKGKQPLISQPTRGGVTQEPYYTGSAVYGGMTGRAVGMDQEVAAQQAQIRQQEAIIKRQITANFAMKRQQAIATGKSVKDLELALRNILNDANLTIEQKAAQIAAYDVGNVPGAAAPVMGTGVGSAADAAKKAAAEKAEKSALRRQRIGTTTSALSMGTMMGSTMLPSGTAQNVAMVGGSIAMFAPQLMEFGKMLKELPRVKALGESVSGLTSRFKLLGGAGNALKGLGPLIFNPWTAAIVAVGAVTYTVYRRMQDSFDQSNTWMRTNTTSAERLGYKYYDLAAGATTLVEKTDAARESVRKLSEEINNAPKDDPYRQISDDWANDKDKLDTISKAVAFYNLQLVRGVDPKKARGQVQALLESAGKKNLILPVSVEIGKIDTTDASANLNRALEDTFSSVTPQSLMDRTLAKLGPAMAVGMGGILPAEGVRELSESTKTLDADKFKAFSDTFLNLVAANQNLSPEKWANFTNTINNSSANEAILNTKGAVDQLRNGFIEATNSADSPMWVSAANSINTAADAANLLYLKLNAITPSAYEAAWASQVAFAQATSAAEAAGRSKLSSIIPSGTSRTSSGGGGGGGKDPYKAQKDANQKRIDQEKDIIKAIEKKRDAEKKAFEEKKKQDDYINKQGDLQIGYREALATGDFAAAARVKNEMLAEQARKRLEDAQSNKDDKYQNEIDKRQDTIDKIDEANKKLQDLSSKAAQASSAAIASTGAQTSNTLTKVQTLFDRVMNNSKKQSFANATEMRNAYSGISGELSTLGINATGFFNLAFGAYQDRLNGAVSNLNGVGVSTGKTLAKLGATVADLQRLGDFEPGSDLQKAFLKKLMSDLEKWGAYQPAKPQGPSNRDRSPSASHSGGPIGPGMVSNRMGKSISGPIRSDERFILAQDGEYMISAAAAGIIGRGNLDAINDGKLPGVPVSGGNSGSSYSFTVNAAPGQDAKQIAQEVHRIFQINERRKGGART